MGLSLKPEHLKRYKDIAMLLIKYGNSDLVKKAGLEDAIGREEELTKQTLPPDARDLPQELAADLDRLGPTFVKLGQLLSTRPDFVPAPYIEALSRLQDSCAPFPFEDVSKIVTTELGIRLSRAFSSFDPQPLAAASLGQTHHAILRNGREVVVKVQRPGIRQQVVEDLDVLFECAEFLDAHTEAGKRYKFGSLAEEFRKSVLGELDYRKEAQNLRTLKENLQEFADIVVPAPIEDYSTSRVLTMEYIKGKKVTMVTPLDTLELDGLALTDEVFHAYLKQILVDGFFHADPHPGNVFLTDDNKIALLDLGMVARLTGSMQERLLQLLLAISDYRAEEVSKVAATMAVASDDFDQAAFNSKIISLVQKYRDATSVEQLEIGRVVLEIRKIAGDCGTQVPAELNMMGKALLNLDEVGRSLCPQFDPNASVRKNVSQIMQQRMLKGITASHVFGTIIQLKDLVEKLPERANKVFDLIANNKVSMKVDTIDEGLLIDAAQKVANRITLGLILASLIMGAAMLMRIQTPFTIAGYPGLAIMLFLCAAVTGFGLIIHISFYDQKPRKYDN